MDLQKIIYQLKMLLAAAKDAMAESMDLDELIAIERADVEALTGAIEILEAVAMMRRLMTESQTISGGEAE